MNFESEHKFSNGSGSKESARDQKDIFDMEYAEQEKKRISFRKLWENIKDRIIDISPSFIVDEDKIVEDYARTIDHSIAIGKQAGKFFDFLAKHGLCKPDKEHEFVDTDSILLKCAQATIDRIYQVRKMLRRRSQSIKETKAMLNERFSEQPITRTEKQYDDRKSEFMTQRINQENGTNVIEEIVLNDLYKDSNRPCAGLSVCNKETGHVLMLNELLPSDHIFIPAEMRETKKEFTPDGGSKLKIIPKSLDGYKGVQDTSSKFYEMPDIGIVGYGNLIKKGQLLALLHEIAHAWQSKYHSNFGRSNWENFYETVTHGFAIYETYKECREKEDKNMEINIFNSIKKKLVEAGVEIDDDYIYAGQPLGKGKYKISSSFSPKRTGDSLTWTKKDFYIKTDRAKPLVEDYVREERDAWAHAIRVLRLLRKHGFDLEPGLKTVEDFQNVVHYALGTYQADIESKLEPTKDIRKFTAQSRFKKKESGEINR